MNTPEKKSFLFAIIVAFGGFIFGLDAAVISGTVRFITEEFGLDELQVGTVVSAPGLGVLFALPLASFVCNRYGRKASLILVAALYLVSAVTSAIAPSFLTLVAARFVGGLAFCSLTLAAMYIGEVAPANWRGKLVATNQINIVVGLSGAYFVNLLILNASDSGAGWVQAIGIEQYTWRWMLGSEIVPAIIWLGLLFLVPESPRWLVFKGREGDARKALERIGYSDQIEQEIKSIKSSMVGHEDEPLVKQLGELFSPRLRMVVIVAFTFAVVQQATGINAILFYAPTVFEQLGGGTDTAFVQAVWVGVVSVIFTFLSLAFVDRAGRRPMVIVGLLWVITSLLVCTYGFKSAEYTLTSDSLVELQEHLEDPSLLEPMVGSVYGSDIEFKRALEETLGEEVARAKSSELIEQAVDINNNLILFGVLSFIAAFQFSIGPIMWVVFSEIFPTSIRGAAIPAFVLISSVTSYIVQMFFPWQLSNMGAGDIFLTYAGFVAVGFVVIVPLLPETKNLTIEQIQAKLKI
ncbi:MAG: MFS transporter [Verrucomicrobiota bacterium]